MKPLIVHLGRTNVVPVSLGYDVSGDDFISEIRAEKTTDSDLIVEWAISFDTNGEDGELVFTLDNAFVQPADIHHSSGYMDLKRITAGEPLNVWDEPLEVLFRKPVTE